MTESVPQVVQQPLQLTGLTHLLTNFGLDFIKAASAEQKPFFLYYAFPQPHHPQFSGNRWQSSYLTLLLLLPLLVLLLLLLLLQGS